MWMSMEPADNFLILNGVLLDFVNKSKGPLPLKRVRQRLEKLTEKGHEYVESRNDYII